jgi:hypothetical protein
MHINLKSILYWEFHGKIQIQNGIFGLYQLLGSENNLNNVFIIWYFIKYSSYQNISRQNLLDWR